MGPVCSRSESLIGYFTAEMGINMAVKEAFSIAKEKVNLPL